MAQNTETLELEAPGIGEARDGGGYAIDELEEERWPLYKTALFVVTSSALLWAGIVAFIGWLL
ncbi:MAG: hypothetical protein RMK73_01290 [Geminicoccaceae bacterium]|nr:hypothetical protein [Geminicoccaceae bacterium]MDW8340097.1 hypothetical protein [Geminicoccaceae bacterium]